MKRIYISLLLVFVIMLPYVESDKCTNDFEYYIERACENLIVNSTYGCAYSNGKCDFVFRECSSYTGKDKTTCESIIPSDNLKKCKIQGNQCNEVYMNCDDYDPNGRIRCQSLYAGESKRCLLKNEKCEPHYDNCGDFTSNVDKTKCEANIPSNSNHKCVWNNNICTEVEKECNDYNSISYYNCGSLSTSDPNKICIRSTNGSCKEQYKNCELYNTYETQKNKSGCEAIKVYIDSTKKFDDKKICSYSETICSIKDKECEDISNENECKEFWVGDSIHSCVFKGNKCKKQFLNCDVYNAYASDKNKDDCEEIEFATSKCVFINGVCSLTNKNCSEIKTSSVCNSYHLDDERKKCVFVNNVCEEQFKTCEIYDAEPVKDKDICEKILLYTSEYSSTVDTSSKCVFNNNKCERIHMQKNCSDFFTATLCNKHQLDDNNKMCVYYNNECKEVYKSCSAYNNDPNKNEEGCKAIKKYNIYSSYTFINYNSICVFEDNTCKEKNLNTCDDYEPWLDKSYCTGISISNSYQSCVFRDNKCKLEYTDCPGSRVTITKEVCESIPASLEYMKCVFDENNNCVSKRRECSEYNDELLVDVLCSLYYESSDENKKCFVSHGVCAEKYYNCSAYQGNDKATCEAILSYDEIGSYSFYYSYKCVFENNKCIKKQKECKEAPTNSTCLDIIPLNNDKRCIFHNGECTEQYKDCETYNNNGIEEIVQSVCESIFLDDIEYKCVFKGNKCIKEQRVCTDFNIKDNFEQKCLAIKPSSEKKCIYSNSACSEAQSSCLELANAIISNETCLTAPTSDKNKICEKNPYSFGCEEKYKNGQQNNHGNNGNSGNNSNNGNNDNNENIGKFLAKSKFSLLFIIFWLLL